MDKEKNIKEERIIVLSFMAIFLLVIFVIFLLTSATTFSSVGYYKKSSISVLNEYKATKITNIECSQKLESISKKSSEIDDKNFKEKAELLSYTLKNISYDLSKKDATDSQIKNWISKIKNI